MADPLLFPDNQAAKLRQLEDRMRVLESTNRLLSSAIRGGALTVYDSSGNVIVQLGDVGASHTGLSVQSPTGSLILEANNVQGLSSPWLAIPWMRLTDFVAVTSGTFVGVYRATTELLWSDQLKFRARAVCDAGTTGELQLVFELGPTVIGGVLTVTSTTLLSYEFSITHGIALGNGPVWLSLQARRASGAGNFNVYEPTAMNIGSNMTNDPDGWV